MIVKVNIRSNRCMKCNAVFVSRSLFSCFFSAISFRSSIECLKYIYLGVCEITVDMCHSCRSFHLSCLLILVICTKVICCSGPYVVRRGVLEDTLCATSLVCVL